MIGALALSIGSWYFFSDQPQWQTMIFTSLAFMQVFQAFASRSSKDSLFKMGLLSNPLLAGMALLVVVLQLMVLYIPTLANFFNVLPLSGYDLMTAASMGLVVFIVMELEKWFKRKE
jgi:P-type Ca2+ transporter type 2C